LLGFGLEYLAHLYVAEKKWSYVLSVWGLIDLLAIIPSFGAILHFSGLGGLRELRILRVMRTLKLIKLAAVSTQEAQDAAEKRRSTLLLDLQIYFIALFTVVIISATLVFHAEASAQPEKFTNIPVALWWAIATVATHGSPYATTVTVWGRVIAGISMLAGVALFGILTSVIGRALLTTLFGSSSEEDDEEDRRAAARRARQRRAVAQRVQEVGQRIGERIERVVEAGGPLPAPLYEEEVTVHAGPFQRLLIRALMDSASPLFRYTQLFIAFTILLSVGAIVLETVDWVVDQYGAVLHVIEWVVLIVFTVEYAAQIYAAEDRRKYLFSFWGVVDLLSILPSYVGLLNITGLKIVRTLRVLRILRILKLTKLAAVNAERTVHRRTSTFWLDLQIYLIALFTAMTVSATLMWFAEHEANPMFANIPEGMWFAIVTLTTTGSGAPIPVTLFGRLVAAATMITGLALFGVLASVIGRAMLTSLFGVVDDDVTEDLTVETGPTARAPTVQPAPGGAV
jgi:voltage-gated potassium channel